ncbi:ERF family protein [Rhodococcus koreensis]
MAELSVYAAWSQVMAQVQAIGKGERYEGTGGQFMFRGIDRVMNAVGPALREHNVIIIPEVQHMESERYTTKSGAHMKAVTVTMKFTVVGPDGNSFSGVSFGEAADSGDKATSKAQSVAYRTFLLQSLTIPTHDPEPDLEVHQRSAPPPQDHGNGNGNGRPKPSQADIARKDLLALLTDKGYEPTEATALFAQWGHGELRETTDYKAVRRLIEHYREMSGETSSV